VATLPERRQSQLLSKCDHTTVAYFTALLTLIAVSLESITMRNSAETPSMDGRDSWSPPLRGVRKSLVH
jgi:hypothetical protein